MEIDITTCDTTLTTRKPNLTNNLTCGSYDDIFRIEMPDGSDLVGFAYDVEATITVRNVEEAK